MYPTRAFRYGILVAFVSACSQAPPPDDGPPTFVGSGACADCHQGEFNAWKGSHHELAMQPATNATVLGDFDNARFEYFGETFEFSRQDGAFSVSALNADGERQSWAVSYAFGIEPLQQYLVEADNGRKQSLPVAWDTRAAEAGGQRWYHLYPDEYVGPGDPLHWTGPYQNWNFMCAECHSTQLVMGYDFDADTFDTTYSEVSVGCEACHGPASAHVGQAERDSFDESLGLQLSLDDHVDAFWKFEPGSSIAVRAPPTSLPTKQAEACGRCHARRGPLAPQYRHGALLADAYSISLLDEPLYFADGQILEEVYVYGSFLQSRMYAAGVTCSDCHEPHSARLRTGDNPSDVCSQCHLPSEFATREHSGHEPADAACVDCHMTSRTYMGIDDRRDHSFRVPRPDLHASIDVPVACNNCHEKDVFTAAGEQKSRVHFGEIMAEARQRPANELIVRAMEDSEIPAIARATLLSLMAPPFGRDETQAIRMALNDPDPLMRVGALRALRLAQPELKTSIEGHGLDDPIRFVRHEAAMTYVDVRDLLPIDSSRAFGAAAEELRETYRAIGSMPDALASLASFESASGNHDDALRYLERATLAAPGLGALHHELGLARVRVGDNVGALTALREAYEIQPDSPRFVYVYGVALNSLGRSDEAIAMLTTAFVDHDGNRDIGLALATMLRDAGRTVEAKAVTRALMKKYPLDPVFDTLFRELERGTPQ